MRPSCEGQARSIARSCDTRAVSLLYLQTSYTKFRGGKTVFVQICCEKFASQYKGHLFKRRVSKLVTSSRQLEGTTHSAHSRRGFEAQTISGGTELAMKMFGTKFLRLLNKDSEKLFPAWHHSDKVTNVAKHFLLSYGRLLWNKPTLHKQRRAVNFIVLYTDNYTFCHVHLS